MAHGGKQSYGEDDRERVEQLHSVLRRRWYGVVVCESYENPTALYERLRSVSVSSRSDVRYVPFVSTHSYIPFSVQQY